MMKDTSSDSMQRIAENTFEAAYGYEEAVKLHEFLCKFKKAVQGEVIEACKKAIVNTEVFIH